jgi:formylglycine-generating enzyme required for sulfatase activity
MGNNPSVFKDCGDDCPVENVSWNDAQNFIKRLNEKEKTHKFRLPTEAEWEYACRAGTNTEFSYGDDVNKLDKYAWHYDNSERKTHPVGQKEPNLWGIYDMHGNVYEWCQDWYGDYASNSVVDPKGPDNEKGRVLRGGSWRSFARIIRSARRHWDRSDRRTSFIGFRVARDI